MLAVVFALVDVQSLLVVVSRRFGLVALAFVVGLVVSRCESCPLPGYLVGCLYFSLRLVVVSRCIASRCLHLVALAVVCGLVDV